MSAGRPIWCHKCHGRIAPYDLRKVFRSREYHLHCFLRMVQLEAQEAQRRDRAEVRSEKRK